MTHATLLDYHQALEIVLAHSARLPAEDCDSEHGIGRVLAEPVYSAADLPPFDNAAMDGFALGGGPDAVPQGTELDVGGEQAAGDPAVPGSGTAWAIMTGARLPDGFDRVVPVEHTQTLAAGDDGHPSRISLDTEVHPAQNVRAAGSDVRGGECVLQAGTLLRSRHLMLLAALGEARVRVAARPRVAVLCTGRELVDDASAPLQPGQIRNSNGPFLSAQLAQSGADVVHAETVGDDEAGFEAALGRALDAGVHAVLTTGAVSMGRYDFVPSVLERIGARTLFHKVAIRPGKPLLFAELSGGVLLFGLPGNPVSGAVGLRFFVEPALRAMTGMPAEQPLRLPLAAPLRKQAALRYHLKARVLSDLMGQLKVQVLRGQESYRIRPLAEANAWVVVEAGIEALASGDRVAVYGMGHNESALPGEGFA